MKLTLEKTDRLVTVDGVTCRIWEGATDSGIPVHALIVRVGVSATERLEEFERELIETRPLTPAVGAYYPWRVVT